MTFQKIMILLNINFIFAWNPNYYWKDPRIHNIGNHGLLGKVHAELAPLFTKGIDILSYDKVNVRDNIINSFPKHKSVLDLACWGWFINTN